MIIFDKGINRFFHSLMPADLQRSLNPRSTTYMRARALSIILVAISIIGVTICLIMGALNVLLGPDVFNYELVLLTISGVILLQTWLFYKFSNYWASSLGFTIFYFLIATIMIILSGGYDSPGKVFLLTSPMIAFLVGGWQEGLQNVILTALFGVALTVLKLISFDLPNIFYGEIPEVMFMVNWLITVMVMLTCFIIYEGCLELSHNASDEPVSDARTRMIKFDNKLETFFHGLVPVNLREHLDVRSHLYARVRILSTMLYVATFLSVLAALLFFPVHWFFEKEHLKNDAIVAGIALLFALQTWAFNKFNNHWISGMLFGYFCFLLVLVLVIFSGGYTSPTMILLMTSPVAFFIIGGMREGIQNAIFVAISGAVFGILRHKGFEFTNLFNDASAPITFGIVWVISVIGIGLCLLVYDLELEKAI